MYLDNIEFGELNIPWCFVPRVKFYSKKRLGDMCLIDESHDKKGNEVIFGKYQVRITVTCIYQV